MTSFERLEFAGWMRKQAGKFDQVMRLNPGVRIPAGTNENRLARVPAMMLRHDLKQLTTAAGQTSHDFAAALGRMLSGNRSHLREAGGGLNRVRTEVNKTRRPSQERIAQTVQGRHFMDPALTDPVRAYRMATNDPGFDPLHGTGLLRRRLQFKGQPAAYADYLQRTVSKPRLA